MSNQRVPFFDCYRGIASLMIIIYHFTLFYSMNFRDVFNVKFNALSWLAFGVQMFYIISGFCVYRSSLRYNNAYVFVKRRVFRMYPTFLLCLCTTSLFIYLFHHKVYNITLTQFIANLTMIPGILMQKPVDGSYWYLMPELNFYFMIGFVILFRLQSKVLYLCGLWMLLCLVNSFSPSYLEIILNLRFGLFFIVGILFSRIYYKESTTLDHIMIMGCLLLSYFVFNDMYRSFGFGFLILLMYLFVRGVFDRIHHPVLSYLSNISYPLFLIHQSVGITILDFLVGKDVDYWISVLIVTVGSITAATLIHWFYEKPLIKLVSKKSNKHKGQDIETV